MARSFSGGVVIRYVLPVLFFYRIRHICTCAEAARRRRQAEVARLTRSLELGA